MKILLALTFALFSYATSAKAETAWAVDSRSLLVSFDTNFPAFVRSLRLLQGLQPGEGILAIDFRPANKKLYGLGSSSRVYVIDTDTGIGVRSVLERGLLGRRERLRVDAQTMSTSAGIPTAPV